MALETLTNVLNYLKVEKVDIAKVSIFSFSLSFELAKFYY